jgi:FGGY-family pentulose kinase
LLDKAFQPLPLNPDGIEKENIIMWMDHRAKQETEVINQTNHPILTYTGGKISIEMQIPKILWLKNNAPKVYQQCAHYFDLPDYLTFKATGNLCRSQCSLVCKWTYLPPSVAQRLSRPVGFQSDFFHQIGLHDVDLNALGSHHITELGRCVGNLSPEASQELGLPTNVLVGTSIIDAYAGAIATLMNSDIKMLNNLAIISGTSSCHIAMSKLPIHVPGVWGPYEGVMLPGYYCMEGGQSATGSLVRGSNK